MLNENDKAMLTLKKEN
jgi:hypothetical protein